MVQNKGLIFKEHVTEWPEEGKHLVIEARDFDLDQEPPAGGVTLKNYYVSFDPYQRGRMRPPEIKSYAPGFPLHQPIPNRGISRVLKSASAHFQPGDIIVSLQGTGTEEYTVLPQALADQARVLDNPHHLAPHIFLGALGMPGLTAWSSLYEIGQPRRGETLVVSAASGAVGQIVGQLAKREGLTVYGSVGDDRKLAFIVDELQFDGGFNYKKERPAAALRRLCPDGVDIYYDNVGGEQLEAAIDHMRPFGRIVACGSISQYNTPPAQQYPIRNLGKVVGSRIKMQGFIVTDPNMGPKYQQEHQEKLQKWISEGTFTALQSVTKGIDNSAQGFIGMLRGDNFGKAVLEIASMDDDMEVKKHT